MLRTRLWTYSLSLLALIVSAAYVYAGNSLQCLNPGPGCAPEACVSSGGTCTAGGVAKAYDSWDQVTGMYGNCDDGGLNCNYNAYLLICITNYYTSDANGPCANVVCGVTQTTGGCRP